MQFRKISKALEFCALSFACFLAAIPVLYAGVDDFDTILAPFISSGLGTSNTLGADSLNLATMHDIKQAALSGVPAVVSVSAVSETSGVTASVTNPTTAPVIHYNLAGGYDVSGAASSAQTNAEAYVSTAGHTGAYGDLTSKPTLGTAAASNVGDFDVSGAAAAVLSSSLQKSSNLSDVASAVAARSNLGLGSAAVTNSTAYDASGAATAAVAAIPNATNATKGLMEGDGSTITCTGGVCTAIGGGGTGSGTVTPSSQYAVAYYPTASNVVSGVPSVANAMLTTNASGIPSEVAITSIVQPVSGIPAGGTMFYEDSGAAAIDLLAVGANGLCLVSNGSIPTWVSCPGGGSGTVTISGVPVAGNATIWAASSVIQDAGGTLAPVSGVLAAGDMLYVDADGKHIDLLAGSGVVCANGSSAPTIGTCGGGSGTVSAVQATGASGVVQTSNSTSSGVVTIGLALSGVPVSALAASGTTVNGMLCNLGSTCTISASAGAITVGTTTVASGTTTYLLTDNAGTLGNVAASTLSVQSSVNVTGTVATANGGLGANNGSATGVPSFATGTVTISTALPQGTTPATPTSGIGVTNVGYIGIPVRSESAAYTTVIGDISYTILHPASDANARTFTIDKNANVNYPVGTVICFDNRSASAVTVAITSPGVITWSPSGSTGSRTLAQYGMACAVQDSTDAWLIFGTGLTWLENFITDIFA